jgi:hypothetical protein
MKELYINGNLIEDLGITALTKAAIDRYDPDRAQIHLGR